MKTKKCDHWWIYDAPIRVCGKCGFKPDPSPEKWEREFDEKFIGKFYQEVTVRGLSSSYDAREEVKSFIRNLLKNQ